MFGLSELAVILVVIVVVLGVRKLSGLVRSAGTATRILKREARALDDADPAAPRLDADGHQVVTGTVVPPRDGTTAPRA
ncbi:sec-independent translocation protein mttA [Actinobacteria bacterium OK074]|nr:sec-independent translocation protein mttA [Actinobacteria bacterium OK074]